jgi:DNA repair protein RadD
MIEFRSRSTPAQPSMAERQAFHAELMGIAQTRSYKRGWVSYKYKERYGQWPPSHYTALQPRTPSPATSRWVQSRNIAYAKARQGAA